MTTATNKSHIAHLDFAENSFVSWEMMYESAGDLGAPSTGKKEVNVIFVGQVLIGIKQ